MKAIIQVTRDGKYFVAADLITNVADQGLTKEEAVTNLKKGLKERYELLMEMSSSLPKTVCLDFEVDNEKAVASVC